MNKSNKFSPEVRERAVRLVQEHRHEYPSHCAALESIADGTPVLRLCTGTSADALRCSVQRIMEPLSPWTGDLAIFCNNTFARRRLALLQFLALAGQTMELS